MTVGCDSESSIIGSRSVLIRVGVNGLFLNINFSEPLSEPLPIINVATEDPVYGC